jgi:acyl-CoA reductase-like NAD-dependent aldehyde dehydrogenase
MPRSFTSRAVPAVSADLHYIDGRRVEGHGEDFPVQFPATGETVVTCRAASDAQVDAAVAAARRTLDAGVWRERPAVERAEVLRAMATALDARRDVLVPLIVVDNAKTVGEARGDLHAAVAALRAAAHDALLPLEERLPDARGVERRIWREPVGVVAAITPFNAPLAFAALKVAPALAAGNSVVLKPSERAPLLPVAVCEAADAAGLPAGVLNLVHGDARVAVRLTEHPSVDMITLTGGTEAGRAAMRAAASTFKRLVLELGGKSAHIVLADADLDAAIPAVAGGVFKNAGQRCLSGTRLLVEERIADEVEARVAALAERLRVGDPFEPDTQVGALIDHRAVDAVEAFVARARADGLVVAAGGRRVAELDPGAFYRPTVLLGATPECHAAQTEVFGPVLTVIRVRDADDAVRAANASDYGLTGAVWTRDVETALTMARRIRTGYFWVNTFAAIFGDLPFGGVKRSGLGREAGLAGYQAYTELKSVMVDTTGGTSALRF